MTLILNFKGQIWKQYFLRNERADWHGTKGMWLGYSWPWPVDDHGGGVDGCIGYWLLKCSHDVALENIFEIFLNLSGTFFWKTWINDVIKWKNFPHYCILWQDPPVSSWFPHKGQWRRALVFSLICTWTNGWANNRDASDLRCRLAHYDITVVKYLRQVQ